MTKTHTLTNNAISAPVMIPNPDLLDLVHKYLPGEAGIAVMYSITGALGLRAARLAGMVANGLASDIRNSEAYRDSINTYNDAMSFLDITSTAEQWFSDAGGTRLDMCKNLTELLHYKRTCDDVLLTLVGRDRMPQTNWVDSLSMAGEPMPVDAWKLDFLWKEYTSGPDADPQMTRAEYDMLNTRELSGQRATWAKHIGAVLNVIDIADKGDTIQFGQLDKRTQLSLLMSYATPERLAKFRTSIMKRARSSFQFDADFRLHKGFVEACRLASTHHRYANLGDAMAPNAQPAATKETAAAGRTLRKDTTPLGKYVEQVSDSVKAEQATTAKVIKQKRNPRGKVVPQEALKTELALTAVPNDI